MFVPTYEADEFQPDVAVLEAAITPRTKVLLLGYPNNPTGAILTRQRALQIAALAVKHDLLVYSDEIYDRLTYNAEHVCFAALPGMKERTVTLGGFSKAYAMTGWRLAICVANRTLLRPRLKFTSIRLCPPPPLAGRRY